MPNKKTRTLRLRLILPLQTLIVNICIIISIICFTFAIQYLYLNYKTGNDYLIRVSYHKIIYYIFVIFLLGGDENVIRFKIHDNTLVVCKYVIVLYKPI